MAFQCYSAMNLARFNSSTSSDFLEDYEDAWKARIRKEQEEQSRPTIAPSSFRCARKTWFRLRETKPDSVPNPDMTLDFTAQIGTACHRVLQNQIKDMLGDGWISISDYFESIHFPYTYELTPSEDSLETKVFIPNLKLAFSVDGVVKYKDKLYLIEIKTSDYNSFKNLREPKAEHISQVICYATVLGIENVLFIYQDRMYGELKVYERTVSKYEMESTWSKIFYLLNNYEKNLPPEKLPVGDKWCNSCPYSVKCKQWG